MSIDNCDHCSRHVDTDDDPEFYFKVPKGLGRSYDPEWAGMCEPCREDYHAFDCECHCQACSNELAEFETTKTCRNCAR